MDKKGYFLIRINDKLKRLEAGYCPMLPKKGKHQIKHMITGKIPQEIYFSAVKIKAISRLDHAAYLGKELQKAYVAMQLGLKYIQDDELFIPLSKASKNKLNSKIKKATPKHKRK